MHRKRTRLAARVNRVATALERRGVVATYQLHDRVLSNRAGAASLRAARRRSSTTTQRTVLERLREDGLRRAAVRGAGARPGGVEGAGGGRRRGSSPRPRQRSPPRRRAASRLCAGARGRSSSSASTPTASSWGLTIPGSGSGINPQVARRRQRVPRHVVEARVRRSSGTRRPAEAESGSPRSAGTATSTTGTCSRRSCISWTSTTKRDPFEYVPRSAPGGELDHLWPWRPLGDNYPPEEEFAAKVADRRRVASLRRRGRSSSATRADSIAAASPPASRALLATVTYSSPASLASLTEQSYSVRADGAVEALAPDQRFALA